MGECIISGGGRTVYIAGSGGSITASAPPVLNTSNPADSTMKALESITLCVFVEENNVNCTYQWFVNDVLISGATDMTYVYTPNTGTENITTHSIKCAVTNNKGTTYSRDAIITVYSTRWYIIKDYTIIDSSASIVQSGYNSSIIQIDGTTITTNKTTMPKVRLLSDALLSSSLYRTAIGAIYETNSYYNCNYPIFIWNETQDCDPAMMEIGVNPNLANIEGITGNIRLDIQASTSTSGQNAYIKIKDLYIE